MRWFFLIFLCLACISPLGKVPFEYCIPSHVDSLKIIGFYPVLDQVRSGETTYLLLSLQNIGTADTKNITAYIYEYADLTPLNTTSHLINLIKPQDIAEVGWQFIAPEVGLEGRTIRPKIKLTYEYTSSALQNIFFFPPDDIDAYQGKEPSMCTPGPISLTLDHHAPIVAGPSEEKMFTLRLGIVNLGHGRLKDDQISKIYLHLPKGLEPSQPCPFTHLSNQTYVLQNTSLSIGTSRIISCMIRIYPTPSLQTKYVIKANATYQYEIGDFTTLQIVPVKHRLTLSKIGPDPHLQIDLTNPNSTIKVELLPSYDNVKNATHFLNATWEAIIQNDMSLPYLLDVYQVSPGQNQTIQIFLRPLPTEEYRIPGEKAWLTIKLKYKGLYASKVFKEINISKD